MKLYILSFILIFAGITHANADNDTQSNWFYNTAGGLLTGAGVIAIINGSVDRVIMHQHGPIIKGIATVIAGVTLSSVSMLTQIYSDNVFHDWSLKVIQFTGGTAIGLILALGDYFNVMAFLTVPA